MSDDDLQPWWVHVEDGSDAGEWLDPYEGLSETELEALSVQAAAKLVFHLGQLVVAAGRVDTQLWALFHSFSFWETGRLMLAWDGTWGVDSALGELSRWSSIDAVRDRLLQVMGKPRPNFASAKGRAETITRFLAIVEYPEQAAFSDWLARFLPVYEQRNRCIHDPWETGLQGPEEWLAMQDGGEALTAAEEVIQTVDRMNELREELSILAAAWENWRAQQGR